jgi:hypothetical protein
MLTLYFATPFRHAKNPHLLGFNEIDQKSRIITPLRGTTAELPVDQARNLLVEDFLIKTKDIPDAWFMFIDDDVLLPTDTLDLWLDTLEKFPDQKVFYGNYTLKKRSVESAHVYRDNEIVTMATGLNFIHKSVFINLRMNKVSAYNHPYDGRWFICSHDKPDSGEDTYFTATLKNINIIPMAIPDLEAVHIDFSRKAAFGIPEIAKNGKIKKDVAYIYAIDPISSPIYKDIVEQ